MSSSLENWEVLNSHCTLL